MLKPNSETGDVEKGSYTLTIVKQTLTVELEDKEIFYGASFDYGEVSGMPEGMEYAVSAAGYAPGSDVGEYPLRAVLTENAENYELVYTEKFLTVLPKEITVEIDD